MATLSERLDTLVRPMDPSRHSAEIARIRSCKALSDLEALARDGWLTAPTRGPRLKLVRHGSGTFLVVEYDDGWSKTISQG
jgi:hypothetical protein